MTIPGVDYAWSHPGGAAIQRAGYRFACRYSSNDATKDISRQEADDLAAHGVWTVVVRETTANRARAGRAAGIADAKAAAARATTAGMPSGRPLYFAIDYDAPADDKAEICDYFRGVASVIGLARTGGYGGYDQLKWLIDAGLIAWVWQTAAWSNKRLLPGRHIYQYAKTVTLNGVSCDVNEALTADFGQWMPGKTPITPQQETDVELTDKITVKKSTWSETDKTASVGDWIAVGNLKAERAAVQAKLAADGVKALATRPAATLTDAQVAAGFDRLAANPAFVNALADRLAANLAARMQS
jgi:hypothetical protein